MNSHKIDMNPIPLESYEEILSLEGYGTKGALSDSDLSILDMLTYIPPENSPYYI